MISETEIIITAETMKDWNVYRFPILDRKPIVPTFYRRFLNLFDSEKRQDKRIVKKLLAS